jgi:transposase
VSYALFCDARSQVPLYYEVYDGNRHDAKQFPLMIERFAQFLSDSFAAALAISQLTLIFDKGNNSKDNFGLIDDLKLHYVGSIKLGEVKDFAEVSNQDDRWIPCQTLGLEKTQCFRVTQSMYGKQRILISPFAVQKVQKLNSWGARAEGRLPFELRTCSCYALFQGVPA